LTGGHNFRPKRTVTLIVRKRVGRTDRTIRDANLYADHVISCTNLKDNRGEDEWLISACSITTVIISKTKKGYCDFAFKSTPWSLGKYGFAKKNVGAQRCRSRRALLIFKRFFVVRSRLTVIVRYYWFIVVTLRISGKRFAYASLVGRQIYLFTEQKKKKPETILRNQFSPYQLYRLHKLRGRVTTKTNTFKGSVYHTTCINVSTKYLTIL